MLVNHSSRSMSTIQLNLCNRLRIPHFRCEEHLWAPIDGMSSIFIAFSSWPLKFVAVNMALNLIKVLFYGGLESM